MSASTILVGQLKAIAVELKKAAVWNGTSLAVDAATDDFLFELYCYFQMAIWQKKKYVIRVAGNVTPPKKAKKQAFNSGKANLKDEAHWPKKPALKTNFSYLSLKLKNGSEAYQLCPGIRVTDKHGKDRAPDINLLVSNASDTPTYSDLCGCWDAKYTSKSNRPLPDIAVSDFIYTFQELGSPMPPTGWTKSAELPGKKSGLLTNGSMSSEKDMALKSHQISETNNFPKAPHTRP